MMRVQNYDSCKTVEFGHHLRTYRKQNKTHGETNLVFSE